MTDRASLDQGPDGLGPVDAVVTWVDGGDPAFRARRAQAAECLRRTDPALAAESDMRFAPARYVQHDEIRYCLRSIVNHAPWMRRIWLVTDDQFPSTLDRSNLDLRVVVVSHRELFAEYADVLPVFNSEAIGVMLWRIAGLSERFVYFNDDVLLTRPAAVGDFFDGERPLLHGKWMSLDESSPSWLRRRVRSAQLFGFGADRFFKEAHTPVSLSRAAIGALCDRHPGLLRDSARRPFRSAGGHSIVALHNHFCLADGRAAIDERNRWLVFGAFPDGSPQVEIAASFARIGSGQFYSACFNGLGTFVGRDPDIYPYLEAGTGSRLAWELPGDAAHSSPSRTDAG